MCTYMICNFFIWLCNKYFTTNILLDVKPLIAATTITTTTTTNTNRGLGGLDVSVNNKGLSQGNSTSTAAKENLLPNELMQTIDKFK